MEYLDKINCPECLKIGTLTSHKEHYVNNYCMMCDDQVSKYTHKTSDHICVVCGRNHNMNIHTCGLCGNTLNVDCICFKSRTNDETPSISESKSSDSSSSTNSSDSPLWFDVKRPKNFKNSWRNTPTSTSTPHVPSRRQEVKPKNNKILSKSDQFVRPPANSTANNFKCAICNKGHSTRYHKKYLSRNVSDNY